MKCQKTGFDHCSVENDAHHSASFQVALKKNTASLDRIAGTGSCNGHGKDVRKPSIEIRARSWSQMWKPQQTWNLILAVISAVKTLVGCLI